MARIMLIDDSEEALELFSALLEGAGHEVHRAQDWVEANAALRLEPDLVLMDVNMPTLEGDRLAKILMDAKPDLKIVLTSAMDESELRQMARKVGVAGSIPKSFDIRFMNQLRRYLR